MVGSDQEGFNVERCGNELPLGEEKSLTKDELANNGTCFVAF